MYKYENDVITNIPSDKIELMAQALRTTPAYIMGWDDLDREQKVSEIEAAFNLLTPDQQKLVTDLIHSLATKKR
jgi:hypothetical protein